MIAALGDLHVGGVRGREAEAGRVEVGDEAGLGRDEIFRRLVFRAFFRQQALDDRRDLGELVEADEGIDLGHGAAQFGGETLGHAAGHDQLLRVVAAMQAPALVGLEDGADAFLLGRVDEGAGVDDHHVGRVGIGREFHAREAQMPGDDFRIDEILGAAERDEADLDRGGAGREDDAHGWCDSRVKVSGELPSLCGP
jgi:hypothetical protein